MLRMNHFTLALLALVLPGLARAQDAYTWMGSGLPVLGAHISSFSYGVQLSPNGTTVTEQPLVLRRRLDPDSQLLYGTFAQGTALANTGLGFRQSTSPMPNGHVLLASVQHQSLSVDINKVNLSGEWQVFEQYSLRTTGLTPTTARAPSTPNVVPFTFRSVQVIAAGLDKVFPSTGDSFVLGVNFGLEHPVTSAGALGSATRALPLVISRRAFLIPGLDNALFMDGVRTQRTVPLLTLKLTTVAPVGTPPKTVEWRFYDVGFTSSRTVGAGAGSPDLPVEQLSFSYKRLEFVGTTGAVTTFNVTN